MRYHFFTIYTKITVILQKNKPTKWEVLGRNGKFWEVLGTHSPQTPYLCTVFQTHKINKPMNKISTSVIIGIVCVVLLGVLVYLNRDKFGTKKATADVPADDTTAAV